MSCHIADAICNFLQFQNICRYTGDVFDKLIEIGHNVPAGLFVIVNVLI